MQGIVFGKITTVHCYKTDLFAKVWRVLMLTIVGSLCHLEEQEKQTVLLSHARIFLGENYNSTLLENWFVCKSLRIGKPAFD